MRQPHVLMLPFHFPPARGSGVNRIRAWANALVEAGADVTALAVDHSFYDDLTGIDRDAATEVSPKVRVVHFRFPHQHLVTDFRAMSWTRGNMPRLHSAFWERAARTAFPERYGHALPILVQSALREHRRRPVDLVLATGGPYVSLGAAHSVARALRIPSVVDYRDAWTMDQFTGRDRFAPQDRAWAWESKIIGRAARTITVNEALAQWYRDRYPQAADRIVVMENGFDAAILNTPLRPPPSGPLSVGYVGTIRPDLPLAEVLAGWRLFRNTAAGSQATLVLHGHLGFWRSGGDPAGAIISSYADDGVSYGGSVPHPQLAATYARFDALLLTLPTSGYVTSAKAYDYLGSGLPVLGAYGPENDTSRVFAESPLYCGVTGLSPGEVADGFSRLAGLAVARTDEQVAATRRLAARHTWSATVTPHAEWLVRTAEGDL